MRAALSMLAAAPTSSEPNSHPALTITTQLVRAPGHSGYIYNNSTLAQPQRRAARRCQPLGAHNDVVLPPHKPACAPSGVRADWRELDEPRTVSLGGQGCCPARSTILQRLSRPARRRYRRTAFSVFGESAI